MYRESIGKAQEEKDRRERAGEQHKEKEQEEKEAEFKKERKLQQAMLEIKKKYGKNAILKGTNLIEGATAMERNNQIGGHKA